MFQGERSQGWWKFNGTEDVKVDCSCALRNFSLVRSLFKSSIKRVRK